MHKMKTRALIPVLLLAGMISVTACTSGRSSEAEAYRTEGISAMAQGSYGKAQDLFAQAMELDADTKTSSGLDNYYYQAIAQFNAQDEDGAIATYGNLIKADEKNADAYFLRANVYLSKQDMDAAEADFNRVSQLKTEDLRYQIFIYESYRKYGQEEKGRAHLQYVLDHGGEDRLACARAKDYLGQTDAAIADYEAAIRAGKKEAYGPLIALLDREQKTEEADAVLADYKGKKLTAGDYHRLVNIQLKRASYEDANADVEKALSEKKLKETDQRQLLADQVACLERLCRFDEAKEKAEAYVKLYPRDGEMIRELELIEYARRPIRE